MYLKRIISCALVLSMILGGFSLLVNNAEAGLDYINDLGSLQATYRGSAWHPDGDFMLAVGNDSLGNGVVHKYDRADGSWSPLATIGNADFNGVANTVPDVWYDNMELGLNGWTVDTWYGSLNWTQGNPTLLPPAPSGQSHGTARSGSNVWWFGNTTTGDYTDDSPTVRVAGSIVSPARWIPPESSISAIMFNHWFEVESGGNYDSMIVSIRNTTDPGWYELKRWDSSNTSFSDWKQEIIMFQGWGGNMVQVNFTFDSQDGSANDYAGWHIDDILIYSNDVYVVVGEPTGSGGYSAYVTDGYSTWQNLGFNSSDFNDVAAGSVAHTFMAVGDHGAVEYWYNGTWFAVNGAGADETLTGIDFNGTHFFIVGYDSAGHSVAYYFRELEIFHGYTRLHPILGAPDWELNDIAWHNDYATQRGKGLGAIAANGTAMSIVNPEMWMKRYPGVNPPARLGHDMIYVPTQHYFVMFGGVGSGITFNETWIYSDYTRQWYNYTPALSPPGRYGHSMVYDSVNDRIVMFGGSDSTREFGDTWVYYPGNNTWQNVTVPGSPSPRYRHDMVYDSANDRVLMFGGDTGAYNDESWEYSGGQWINHTGTVGTAPSPRDAFSMAFDSQHNLTILFGGQSSSGFLNDTWIFNVTTNHWVNRTPTVSPPVRFRHSLAYDPHNDRAILYGGFDGSTNLNDTWLYDMAANKWNNPYPGARPSPRRDTVLAYNSDTGEFGLFGGTNGTTKISTWVCTLSTAWNGNTNEPAKIMNGENLTAVAWDTARKNAIFVGNDANGGVVYSFGNGTDYISKVPGLDAILQGHTLNDISYIPKNPAGQAVLLGGSAFMVNPSMVDSSTRITVNVEEPHIFDVDFRDQTNGISRLNQQVDVNHVYTFYVEANYSIGGIDHWSDASLTVSAWYDEGHVGLASTPENNWNTPDNRTRQFNLTYDVSAGTTTLAYPVGPALEFTLDSTWEDPNIHPGDRHRLYINVSFQAQTRMANGQGFVSGAAASGRIWDQNAAFNDPDSWDFMVRMYDEANTAAYNRSFGEFGIKETVSISVTGNPSGNVPPGSANISLANPSQITYSSNTNYWVNVSIPDLLENGVGPASIPATDITVANSNNLVSDIYTELNPSGWPLGRPFQSAGADWCVWGNRSQVTQYMPVPLNGTTSFGPWGSDYNLYGNPAGTTQLDWWITVQAGKVEGTYQATIKITVDS